MAIDTKQMITEKLFELLSREKSENVTVKRLVEECGISRQTFYYHFQDIYDLLKWTLEQEAIEVVKNFDLVVNTEEALRFVMDYVDKNKHIINGAFDSMGYEEIKRFFTMTSSPSYTAQSSRASVN